MINQRLNITYPSRRVSLSILSFVVLITATNGFVPVPRPKVMNQLDKPLIFNPFGTTAMPLSPSGMRPMETSIKTLESKSAIVGDKKQPAVAWRLVVLAICLVWSTNFAVIKEIFQAAPTIDPSLYAAIRFSLASLVMLPRTFNSIKNTELIGSSMAVGLSVFFGYFGQSIGLLTTTANKSSFICSLNVVWVALIASFMKKEFKAQSLISAFLAVVGVAVLELDGNSPPVIGDLWSVCQPIGFGTGYIMLESIVTKFPDNPGAITAFKIISIAIASIIWAAACGHTLSDLTPILQSNVAVAGLLYTGFITTAAALWVQSYAFEEVPATDVSIILSTEPIFATLFAAGFIGESIDVNDIVGGAIILIACLSNEFNLYDRFINQQNEIKNV